MADIKTKARGTVKTIDKTVNTSARIKSNIVSTKDKLENTYNPEGENEIEYASNKITNGVNIAKDKGIYTFNKYASPSSGIITLSNFSFCNSFLVSLFIKRNSFAIFFYLKDIDLAIF